MPHPNPAISDLLKKEDTAILQEHPAINAREARSNFSKIVQAARYKNNRVIVTDHGEPAAALVPIHDVRLLDLIDQMRSSNRIKSINVRDFKIEELERLLADDNGLAETVDVQAGESDPGQAS